MGRDNNVDTIKITAEKRAIEIIADFNVYFDGSPFSGLLDGGAGVVVTRGNQFRLRLLRPYDGEVPASSLVSMRKKRGFWMKWYSGYKRVETILQTL